MSLEWSRAAAHNFKSIITGGSPSMPVVHAEPSAAMDRSAVFVLPPMTPEGQVDEAPPPAPEPAPASPIEPPENTATRVVPPTGPPALQTSRQSQLPAAAFAVPKRGQAKAEPAETAKPTGRKGRPCVDPIDGITQLAPGSFAVEKEVLDHYTNSKNAEGLGAAFWHETAAS